MFHSPRPVLVEAVRCGNPAAESNGLFQAFADTVILFGGQQGEACRQGQTEAKGKGGE